MVQGKIERSMNYMKQNFYQSIRVHTSTLTKLIVCAVLTVHHRTIPFSHQIK